MRTLLCAPWAVALGLLGACTAGIDDMGRADTMEGASSDTPAQAEPPAPGAPPAESEWTRVGVDPAAGYEAVQYKFRHPATHGESQALTVTQHVEVLIPDGVEKDAPVFLLFDNEQDSTRDFLLKTTAVLRYVGAKMIYVSMEHRGYGQSVSDDDDQTIPAYVSHEQAIHDAHAVVRALQEEFTGPWMVLGYSYGGSLVTAYGAAYPDDARVFISSSGLLRWPALNETYEGWVRKRLGDATFAKAAAVLHDIKPARDFDDTWMSRELLEVSMTGLTQYSWAQPYVGIVGDLLSKPLDEVLATVRSLDMLAAGGLASRYANARATRKVSRTDLLERDLSWRVFFFQQCSDFGVFHSSPVPGGIYARTGDDLMDECRAQFGDDYTMDLRPGRIVWDQEADLDAYGAADGPKLVFVRGGNDPWQDHGIAVPNWAPRTQSAKLAVYDTRYGLYIDVPAGFHGPDRDDAEVSLTMFAEALKAGGIELPK